MAIHFTHIFDSQARFLYPTQTQFNTIVIINHLFRVVIVG